MLKKQTIPLVLIFILTLSWNCLAQQLASWNDGPARQAIETFVQKVTDPTSPDYVPPAERIAVFDNDGTLWSEQPVYFQLQYALDKVRQVAAANPKMLEEPLIKAVVDNDMETVMAGGKAGLFKLVMLSHANMTTEQFAQSVRGWVQSAQHPRFKRLYTELVFQPMLELLEYLREHGFTTYIVSGGGVEFMRVFGEEVYGIPPEQIIGSTITTRYEMWENGPVLVRLPELDFIDDKEGKPVAINKFIGRRPLAAFGNSDGDLQMLQWTDSGEGARFCLYVHHTDAEREYQYDRESAIGKFDQGLDEAGQKGWTIVDMKKDWKVIYPFELK